MQLRFKSLLLHADNKYELEKLLIKYCKCIRSDWESYNFYSHNFSDMCKVVI